MLRSYFLVAIRNLWRNKVITGVNLLGMAIGFGIFLTFWSWVRLDLSFDRFHEDFDQIFILNSSVNMDGSEYTAERVGGVFALELPGLFPEVLSGCRLTQPQEFELGVVSEDTTAEIPIRYFNVEEVLAVDTNFFDFFSFELVDGDRAQVFREEGQIVLTESLAERMYGEDKPLGRSIRHGEGCYYTITGIVRDPPENSTYQFDALLSFDVMDQMGWQTDGAAYNLFFNNLKLSKHANPRELNSTINDWVEEHFDLDLDTYFFLSPLSKVYLHGESKGIIGLYMNLILAVLMLAIACINFINLTTAYSTTRGREIHLRKCMGAGRRQLLLQFMMETYLLLMLAIYLGFFLAEHLHPFLSREFGIELEMNHSGLLFWIQMLALYILTGLLAGLYPAWKISKAVNIIADTGTNSTRPQAGKRSRKVLLVIQFTFSVLFIILSVFIMRQYVYMKEADLGFNREDVIYVRTTGLIWREYPHIKEELEKFHFVKSVSSGSEIPVMLSRGVVDWGTKEGEQNTLAVTLRASPGFHSTFEIPMRKGRFFHEGQDSLNRGYVVVNQDLVDAMNWEDPIGKGFHMEGNDLTILGVTENFHFFPFNLDIFKDRALIFLYSPVDAYVFIRLHPESTVADLEQVAEVFKSHNPAYEVNYDRVSNHHVQALENAEGMKLLLILFSVLAVFVAAMGLIGLSVYHNNSRTRELGIRKALGAQSGSILRLLLSEFMSLVVLSNLIAIPLAYLIMSKILQFFTYRIDLDIMVFVLVFIASLLLAAITVIVHALQTARTNPMKSIRYE